MVKIELKSLQSSIIIGLCTSLTACSSDTSSMASASREKVISENAASQQVESIAPMNLNEQIQFSVNDLARRLAVPPESIKVFQARNVTWRSGAMGCPKPGMSYTDALVPGSLILLQSDKFMHAYHASMRGQPFYCPKERAESPAPGTGVDVT